MKVGFRVWQSTTTDCSKVVGQTLSLGETVSVRVTWSGVGGQVKTGLGLAALSNFPAVAVQA